MRNTAPPQHFPQRLTITTQTTIFYWVSVFILGGFADMPNVSMDSDYFWIHRHFIILVCFCVWLSNPPRHEARRYGSALGNAA